MRILSLILAGLLLVPSATAGASDEDDSKWTDGGSVLRPRDGVDKETMRTGYSASPPCTCGTSPCLGGTIWTDSDTQILYLCDDTRDKWLSVETITLWGEESASCAAGKTLGTSSHCTVDWGDSLGPDKYANLGMYIPRDMTIVAFGYSQDVDTCTSGSFDIEVWGSQTAGLDQVFYLNDGAELATDQTGERASNASLDLDVDGPQYIIWGVNNSTPGCSTGLSDYNIILYAKWRTS